VSEPIFSAQRGDVEISTDRARLDIARIHSWLSTQAYWALGRPLATVQRAIEHSLCFGIYRGDQQIGFARAVTDYATFAWICDVFISEEARGAELGKWLIATIVAHPAISGLRLTILATRDAHGLYERYGGFSPLQAPERWMERRHSA
jgi:GNAT superfamily N-acetyltransferase